MIGRRFDALRDAIDRRSWADVEWHFDNARSAVDKHLGVRGRPYDTPPTPYAAAAARKDR